MHRRIALLFALALVVCSAGAQELYFEEPRTFAAQYRLFPRVDASDRRIVVGYQEVVSSNGNQRRLRLVLQTSTDGLNWSQAESAGEAIPLVGQEIPPVFDLAISSGDDAVILAVVGAEGQTEVRRRAAPGEEWETIVLLEGEEDPLVTEEISTTSDPRLFHRSSGGYLLFVTRFVEPNVRLLYATSDDGVSWSPLRLLPADTAVGNIRRPAVATVGDRDYLFVDAENPFADSDSRIPDTFQIYSSYSDDGGRTWITIDADRRVTTSFGAGRLADTTNSRSPTASTSGSSITLYWDAGDLYEAAIDRDGLVDGLPEVITAVNTTFGRLRYVAHEDGPIILAETNASADSDISFVRPGGRFWRLETVSQPGLSVYPDSATFKGRLHVFWYHRDENTFTAPARVVYLEPDQRAAPPTLAAVNYDPTARSRLSTPTVSWRPAPDASGVAGYSLTWGRDPRAQVPTVAQFSRSTTRTSLQADEDGPWYARLRTLDNAGNWSPPATISFYRDTTPPPRVSFVPPSVDEDGYLASNTFVLQWRPPEDDVIGGYSYEFAYLGPETGDVEPEAALAVEPPRQITTTETSISRQNNDDGLWALAVRAVDSVGNVGEASTLILRLNKYVPSTQIWTIAANQDPLDRYNIEVVGRGFAENGVIRTLYVDRDRRAPYDYVYTMGAGDFMVSGNGNIEGPILDNLATGEYYIGVLHPERGVYFEPQLLSIERNGTIKYGDFTVRSLPDYIYSPPTYGSLSSVSLLAWVVIALLFGVAFFSGTRVVAIAREGRYLTLEARALIQGGAPPALGYGERTEKMKRRGVGLRLKFTFFVVIVVVAIVSMLAIGLGSVTLSSQQQILAQGLKDRVDVLVGSMSSGAAPLLQDAFNNGTQIDTLTIQSSQMPEADYATITAESLLVLSPDSAADEDVAMLQEANQGASEYDYVWGTDDALLEGGSRSSDEEARAPMIDRAKVPADAELTLGVTRVVDPVSELIPGLEQEVNRTAREALGDRPERIEQAREIEQTLRAQFLAGEASSEEWQLALGNVSLLTQQATAVLSEVTAEVRSYPEFDVANFDRNQDAYIFYKPIAYLDTRARDERGLRLFRGVVRMGVNTVRITDQIDAARAAIVRVTILIALAAVGAGVVGALLLATIVVIPIRKLVRGVERIRDTEDKEELRGEQIDIRSRDELSVLAETINSMARNLAEAAAASKDLTMGKNTQKMFVPLEIDEHTQEKGSTASEESEYAQFFGYYEGAKGVSGDYFAYQRLDDEHYAVIKSDAAGKGVAAALIMVQVATLFTNYFREWSAKRNGFDLSGLVATINDLIAAQGFAGRFATLAIAIINTRTGDVHLTHAGDALLHWFDGADLVMRTEELQKGNPAAGMMPGASYRSDRMKLRRNDSLLLFTDGLEEAMRVFRDETYHEMPIDEVKRRFEAQGIPESRIAKGNNPGDKQVTEEFGMDRVRGVVEAVNRHGTYRLERLLNPNQEELLVFEFGDLEPSPQNTVFALIAVEKVFRLFRDPKAGRDDQVDVDRKIDAFLSTHFRQYNRYFGDNRVEDNPRSPYVRYSHLKEDAQYDDLTVLAIRKK